MRGWREARPGGGWRTNRNDGKEEAEMNKDGGNATATTATTMTTVMATTSRMSREHEREERGSARRRTEDKQK